MEITIKWRELFSDHRKKDLYLRTLFVFLHFHKLIMSKILIIDDEVQIRSLLARMLPELEGYEVCQAGDCKRAAIQTVGNSTSRMWLCVMSFFPMGNGVDLVLNIKKTAPECRGYSSYCSR